VQFDNSLEFDDANEQFQANVAARDAAAAGIGSDGFADEIPPGAALVYWLARDPSHPATESLEIRFNDFERN
jgi:hypothetical protein